MVKFRILRLAWIIQVAPKSNKVSFVWGDKGQLLQEVGDGLVEARGWVQGRGQDPRNSGQTAARQDKEMDSPLDPAEGPALPTALTLAH